MPEIGIRELKNQTSEILRAVREEQAEYIITHRGKPVAVLLPVTETRNVTVSPTRDFWDSLDALSTEIDDRWKSDKSAIELLQEH